MKYLIHNTDMLYSPQVKVFHLSILDIHLWSSHWCQSQSIYLLTPTYFMLTFSLKAVHSEVQEITFHAPTQCLKVP